MSARGHPHKAFEPTCPDCARDLWSNHATTLDALAATRLRLSDALALLAEIQWEGRHVHYETGKIPWESRGCPYCKGEARRSGVFPDLLEGHANGCRLAALLARPAEKGGRT